MSTPQAPEHSDTDDGLIELTKDHDEVRAIFAQLRDGASGDQREQLVREMTEELVRHTVAEEIDLYPLIREVLPDGDEIADHEIEEHGEVEQALKRLEKLDSTDPEYERTVKKVIDDVTHHAADEEDRVFPQLRQTCSTGQLQELGDKLRSAKRSAPTHPHPASPDSPLGHRVMGPMAGLVDRIRDAVSSH